MRGLESDSAGTERGRNTPWTGHQPITGLACLSVTPAGNVGSPIYEPACFWTVEGKWSKQMKK